MKKGFTLVELLAVIVIVGVLGIITVPMAMKAVENARESAFEAGAQSVLEAAVTYVTRVEETGEIPVEGIKVKDISEEITNEKYISGVILKNSDGSITVEGLSDGEFCASGTKNTLRVIKGNCSDLDNTPPTLKVMLNKRTSNSITIVANGQDATSGIYGYQYSIDGINYGEIVKENIYTVTGLKRNETIKIYVRVYNNVYDKTSDEENLSYSMTEEVVEYTTLNIEKPEFKISTSENSASTVKIVEIIYPENIEGYEYSYILNGKEEKVEGTTTRITMLENGTIIAKIKTKTEEIENKLVIAGLDNTGPVGNIVYEKTWEKSKKIKVEVLYEQTGLPSEPYSYDGGITWTSSNEKVYVNREKITGKIQVRDVLGNITKEFTVNGEETEEIEIGYIDNEKPTCKLKITSGTEGKNGWYISNVGVDYEWMKDTANYCENNKCEEQEPGSGIKTYSIDNPIVKENRKIVVTGTVEDNVGNRNTCSITVNKDDKKPEKPTITASDGKASGTWHGNNFNLNFSGSSSVSGITYQYSTNGSNYTNGSSVTISANTTGTTYYVRACNNAGICSDVSSYTVKLDKDIPTQPTITASDGKASGTWHNRDYNLTFSGSSSISGITYQYSTDGNNYTNGNTVVIGLNTSQTTYYVRACNGAEICSNASVYQAKLDKDAPNISAKQKEASVLYQQSKDIKELFNINYGISSGNTTCYLIQNNARVKSVSNNNELSLGINIIECVATSGAGIPSSDRVTIKHYYNANAYCTAGTLKNGTCFFEKNKAVCGTTNVPHTQQVYNACKTTVNTCQGGYDSEWDSCLTGSPSECQGGYVSGTGYGQCAACGADYSRCKTWGTTTKQYSSTRVCQKNCDGDCNGGTCTESYCKSYYYAYCNSCPTQVWSSCATTKNTCQGGYYSVWNSCKSGSPNTCQGGYDTVITYVEEANSCNNSSYIRYTCPSGGVPNGSICEF